MSKRTQASGGHLQYNYRTILMDRSCALAGCDWQEEQRLQTNKEHCQANAILYATQFIFLHVPSVLPLPLPFLSAFHCPLLLSFLY